MNETGGDYAGVERLKMFSLILEYEEPKQRDRQNHKSWNSDYRIEVVGLGEQREKGIEWTVMEDYECVSWVWCGDIH